MALLNMSLTDLPFSDAVTHHITQTRARVGGLSYEFAYFSSLALGANPDKQCGLLPGIQTALYNPG